MRGKLALDYLIENYDFNTILDIGSGKGEQTKVFERASKEVTRIDRRITYPKKNYIRGDYLDIKFNHFDAIWACHVLEHQYNPNLFLKKINRDLKENGVLAITVPPLNHPIVCGHVSLWNAGLLLYNLILAGFDCKNARIKQYGNNISVIIQKHKIEMPKGDSHKERIKKLFNYFPMGLKEGFNGNIKELNWNKI